MAEVRGYAISTGIIPYTDHTYVTSSDGDVWPCFGRSDGGRQICSDFCDAALCRNYAGHDSHAEIRYSITGVCHQAANRILIPIGETVKDAWGYTASKALYGVYGTDAEEFFRRHNIDLDLITTQSLEMADDYDGERKFIMNVQNLYKSSNMKTKSNNDESVDFASEEFKLFLQYKLGENFNTIDMDKLIQIHKQFHIQKDSLISNLNNKKFSPEEYTRKLNKEISDTLDRFSKELRPEEFEKIFDIKPGEQVNLVKPEIMINEYKPR